VADLTLLFATFNGALTLPRLLDALEQQAPPRGGWKIVAVDNGGQDGGGRTLSERAGRLPLTVISEARRGKSAALNAGLGEIEGDLIVFTDDDVVPPRNWLAALRALADAQPDYDIFGGAIEPVWPFEPPDWVLRCAPRDYFAWTHFDEGPAEPTAIWRPNMAVRRTVLSGRRFFEGIGPNGGAKYAVGAETELLLRAAQAGHLCWHSPAIVVGHIVEPHQLTAKWLLQRARNHARGARRMFGADRMSRMFGASPELIRRYLSALAAVVFAHPQDDFETRFKAQHELALIEGDLVERLSLHWRRAGGHWAPTHPAEDRAAPEI
jgi:glycosyltransferase involved in cell wall biosynthesis